MIKKSITEELSERYKQSYLENSTKLSYTDISKREGLQTVLYDELKDTEVSGYPIASDLIDEKGKIYSSKDVYSLTEDQKAKVKLRYHFLPNYHELYVGTTGSGKTTGCVEPQLRAISAIKNKPNLFITDPKGELFEHNARHLAENGYKIFVMNFKDITHSHRWNPLMEMYEKKQTSVKLGKNVKFRQGAVDKNLIPNGNPEEFNGKTYIEYDGRAFPNGESCDYYISFQRDCLEAEISTLVNQFATMIIEIKSTKDPSWEYGAQQLLKGIILCMLEDSVTPKSGFTADMMTIFTIQNYYLRLRNDILSKSSYTFNDHPLLKNKPKHVKSFLAIALNNAPNTMLSYCGVFDGAIKNWFQSHIFALTTGNTIDLDNLTQPYATFVITRDYEKSDFAVAGLFIDWVYKQALQQAENAPRDINGMPTTRPLHFLLDEFGNIPRIPDFENKIATSRSRNIWFHLFVQSYEQIDLIYSPQCASIIIDNCNAQIFLGSQSRKTKEKFSVECGKHWVPSLAASLSPEDTSMIQADVVPISDLDLIEIGQMFNKRLYKPVILSQYIRSYLCASLNIFKNFRDSHVYHDFTPVNMNSFRSKVFSFKLLDTTTEDDEEE